MLFISDHMKEHTNNHTTRTTPLEIGFIGTFNHEINQFPTPQQYQTLKVFLNHGVRTKKIDSHYSIAPSKCYIQRGNHHDHQLDKEIQTWKHFSSECFQ